ncbi:metallophosphoesterase family protein [Candidatus Woesearchaeota archaeon]|nr:metallophosphoesterase family protein [Candidatus Woesearchaeota archaeon]
MKILACSDIHGNKKAIISLINLSKTKNPDIIICAGDISGSKMNSKEILNELKKTKKPILVVHGNHETSEEIKSDKQLTNLHKKIIKIENYTFIGFGGGGFSKRDIEFENFSRNIKKKNMVLVTHAPPYNTILDILPVGHIGSSSIKKFIEKNKPILAICGHLHENEGKSEKINKTLIINPGIKGEIILI